MATHTVSKDAVLVRLRRIEGQVKGIARMVEDEKGCLDILVQIAAVRSAINKVGGLVLEKHSKKCVMQAAQKNDDGESLNELIDMIIKFIK